MNALLACLERHRQSLGLERYGIGARPGYVMKTPRFAASRHVIALIFAEGGAEPVLVAKTPRIAADRDGIDREAQALRDMRNRGAKLGESIPQLVGVVDCQGHPVLLQTAVSGAPLDPGLVQQDRALACRDVTSWLIELHGATAIWADDRAAWYETQVEQPVRRLAAFFGERDDAGQLVEQARVQMESLASETLPYVVEHGDVSHPNLFRLRSGKIGVIDWELAEMYGVPLADVWFFLTYAACATAKSRTKEGELAAFREAFFGPSPWTKPHVDRYVRALSLPHGALAGLFVLTWTRRVAALARQLGGASPTDQSPAGGSAADAVRNSRYYAFWRQAVTQCGALHPA